MTRPRVLLLATVLAVVGLLGLAGCGSDNANNQQSSPTSGNTKTSTTGLACTGANNNASGSTKLPASFPAPPPGSALCSVSQEGADYIFTTNAQARQILEYYQPALTAAGCTAGTIGPATHAQDASGDLELSFDCAGTRGYIVTANGAKSYTVSVARS